MSVACYLLEFNILALIDLTQCGEHILVKSLWVDYQSGLGQGRTPIAEYESRPLVFTILAPSSARILKST